MAKNLFKNSRLNRVIFIASLVTSGYWFLVSSVDVYYFIIVGAVYEILWLPSIAFIITLPVIALILFIKDKFNLRSLNLYSTIIIAATIFIIAYFYPVK